MNDQATLDALIDQFGTQPDGLIWVGGHRDRWAGRCFASPELASAYATALDRRGGPGDGVYTRTTTLRAIPTKVRDGVTVEGGRGEIGDSATVVEFKADLDIAGPGHKNDRYPTSLDDLKMILAKGNFPEPTRWDFSGGGYYAVWSLAEPVSVRDDVVLADVQALWHALKDHLISTAKEAGKTDANPLGWKIDSVSNLDRVFRLPGTWNRKPEMAEPLQCVTISTGGPRYTLDELRAILPVKEEPAPSLFDQGAPLGEAPDEDGAQQMRTPKLGEPGKREHDGVWTRSGAVAEVNSWVEKLAAHKGKGYGFNDALRDTAVRLGRFVPGLHTRAEAEKLLEGAISSVFKAAPDVNDKATMASGLDHGVSMPYTVTAEKAAKTPRKSRQELETFGSIKLADLAEPAFRGRFRWCAQLGWLAHDGARWVPDNEPAALRALVDVIKGYTYELLAERGLGREDYDELKSLSGSSTQTHALKILRGAPGVATRYEEFDALPAPGRPWTVPCANGITVELWADGRVTTRLTAPTDMNTKTAVAYVAGATAPRIGAAFADYQPDPDVRRFKLQLWCRALSGIGAENFVADIGAGGGNGKGTMYGLIKAVFGDYAYKLPIDVILKRHTSAREAFRSELADLRGCRHIFCEEPAEGVAYDLGVLKDMTGGGEIDGRAMFKQAVKIKANWLFEMAANKRPIWPADDAMSRRYVEISWDFSIVNTAGGVQENFKEELKAEASGFLNEILRHWTGVTKPTPPDVVQRQTVIGSAASSPLAPFVENALETDPGAAVPARALFAAYGRWALQSNVRGTVTETKFGSEMKRFFPREGRRSGNFYLGVKIKEEFDSLSFKE